MNFNLGQITKDFTLKNVIKTYLNKNQEVDLFSLNKDKTKG